MKIDPEKYRREQRQDLHKVVLVVVATFLLVLILGWAAYLTWQTHALVAQHTTDLRQLTVICKALNLRGCNP